MADLKDKGAAESTLTSEGKTLGVLSLTITAWEHTEAEGCGSIPEVARYMMPRQVIAGVLKA